MHQFAKLKSLDKGAEVRFLLLPLKGYIYMNFVPTWAKTNTFGTGQGEELLEEQQLRERTFELLASENITCDKTTLFKSGESLIDEVIAGLHPEFTLSDLF